MVKIHPNCIIMKCRKILIFLLILWIKFTERNTNECIVNPGLVKRRNFKTLIRIIRISPGIISAFRKIISRLALSMFLFWSIQKWIRSFIVTGLLYSCPIHDYGKDGGMYIFPGCIIRHLMRNFSRINKSTTCLTSVFHKTSIRFL